MCVCVFRADVPTVDDPLSSIKRMSGLINHDTTHPPLSHMSLPAAVYVHCHAAVLFQGNAIPVSLCNTPECKKTTKARLQSALLLNPAVSNTEGRRGGKPARL